MLAGAALFTSCSKDKPEYDGFNPYRIGKTSIADVGKCIPEGERTKCILNVNQPLAGHKTQVDLFFNSPEEASKLVEIQVAVFECKPGAVSADLSAKMGDAKQVSDKRALWTMKKMHVVAQLPQSQDLCVVHFVGASEAARLAELFPAAAAAPR